MNKRSIITSLNKIANELDSFKLYKESNEIVSVMQKLAMPISRNQMISQEISESLIRFNVDVQRMEKSLEQFNRVLRVLNDSIDDRRPDYEEIFRHRRKLQESLEEIKNDNLRLNDEMREINRLSSMIENSMQDSGQQNLEQMNKPTQMEGDIMSDSESDTNMDSTSSISGPRRRPFRN